MAFLSDEVFDQGLDWVIANCSRLDICSQEPTTYAEATSTYTLGNATATAGATEDGATDGRRVQVTSAAGSATGTGTVTHWAVTDGSSVLIATGSSASTAITSGDSFLGSTFSLTIRDAT